MKKIKHQDFEQAYKYVQAQRELKKATVAKRSARRGKHNVWMEVE